jgi:cytochrome c2
MAIGKQLPEYIKIFIILGNIWLWGIWGCTVQQKPDELPTAESRPDLSVANREETRKFAPPGAPAMSPLIVEPVQVGEDTSKFEAPPPSAADIFLGLFEREGLGRGHLNLPVDRSKSGNQILFETKCSRCHPLSRPLSKTMTTEEWDSLTMQMRSKLPIWISEEERKSIVYYLVKVRGDEPPKEIAANQALFEDKCSLCHSIDRPLFALKSLEEWPKIVERMRDKDPEWITEVEAQTITTYLVENIKVRRSGLHDVNEVSDEQALFEIKCSRCHVLDRPLKVEDFDTEDWARTVYRMRSKVPDWISEEEANTIVNYLIKVQSEK